MIKSKSGVILDCDFSNPPFGREDPIELIERGWQYLHRRQTGEFPAVKNSDLVKEVERKTQAELVSAHVQASLRGRTSTTELERRLADAEATITRLLAFVPTRAGMLAESHVEALADGLRQYASSLLPNSADIRTIVIQDTSWDSPACHRIEMVVPITLDFPPAEFAALTQKLHVWLAKNSSAEEFLALNLIVEPELQS